ncbi:type II CAAX endopeptidase family protein [Streptococcus sp. DTU_2020_1001019_1_SI_AUS_MUR_006]|uniref:CPBP family intramembrane glutamic endopeptidase n=1 Tax=Streptococcus sp. DTU_2020_1001019_1_SI_AUS_MUR_006 TaxID=3077584 RepID=UPI0028EE56E8|nr:type II CAAX endopeptidase family protein [Streptococcus sp. DTU_2020_1001019_1_SI_AUS_MUR_006]WNS72988.1 type II CAAX endopeptidase family protein [Streptococcus sp. DTU_2020_1001019_1_SI_AUS_MUR_006]
MMSNKNKGILIFSILYTVLFVFDGIRVFDAPLPSSAGTYLVYTIMFVYGCFLFKSLLLQKWEEVRNSKRKFIFGVLTGWIFLFLMTVVFGFVSEMLRQFFGLVGQGLNQSNIQSTFQEQPLLIAVFACIIGPIVEELFFRQILLRYLRKNLPTWLSVFLVGLAFALTHMHSLSLSEWVGAVGYLGGGLAFSIIYVKEKENIYYPLLVHMLSNSLSLIILAISSM